MTSETPDLHVSKNILNISKTKQSIEMLEMLFSYTILIRSTMTLTWA